LCGQTLWGGAEARDFSTRHFVASGDEMAGTMGNLILNSYLFITNAVTRIIKAIVPKVCRVYCFGCSDAFEYEWQSKSAVA
jgi:hypothetical protein